MAKSRKTSAQQTTTSAPANATPEQGMTPDLEDRDERLGVIRESSRGGHEPPPEVNDTPEQNVGYDEAVKGAPLTDEERERAERESPLADPSASR